MNLNNYFTKTILDRGRRYQKRGLVEDVVIGKNEFTATVIGSMPYHVSIWKKANRQWGMSCTCPYAEDGNRCKHMAAVCIELEDLLDDTVIVPKKPVKPKQVNERVYPFPAKNTKGEKEYTYFDLSVMTREIKIMSNTLEAARKLIEKNEIYLQKVEVGYRGQYRMQPVLGGTATAVCKTTSGESLVEVHFSANSILAANCEVYRCNTYYDSNYYYSNHTMCPHQVAVLLLLADYIDRYNPGDNTDFDTAMLMRRYQQMNRNQMVGEVSEIVEDVHLEPRLECMGDDLQLSFRTGTNKLFVVKNLTEFVQNVEKKQVQKFGKSTEIDFNIHKMHEDSKGYYQYIRRIVREEQRRYEMGEFFTYNKPEIGSSISLYGSRLDDFYALMSEKKEKVAYTNKLTGEKGLSLTAREKDPVIQMNLKGIFNKNKVFTGIKAAGNLPVIFNGENKYYFIEPDYFNKMSTGAAEVLEPLFEMTEEGAAEFSVGRKSLSDFYYHTMPLLSQYIDFKEEKGNVIETYLPPKAEFRFYLDAEKERITCDARVGYGENEFSLMERMDKPVQAGEEQDIHAEAEAAFHITRYFSDVDQERRIFVCGNEPEAVFSVLESGIKELFKIGEVFCTDRLKNVKVHKKTPLKVGVSLESGIMNLDISSEEFSNQELLDILASYRKKKKYHRLKNGDFLNIEDENLEMLAGMVDTLHVSSKEFLKGNIKIPAYRALYLDKLLEKNESLYVERDKHFKSLIKEFKTIVDSDFEVPKTLHKVLRNYQVTGYRWLRTLDAYSFGGILADDMGLGKTLQMISVLQAAKEEGKEGTSLIVTPASLVYNWQEEFTRFAPDMKALVVSGTQSERTELLKDYQSYDVLITSYDLLKRDIDKYEEAKFLYQVIDEAQYIKNHTTAAAKAVKCIQSQTKYALTGTPIENRLSELWSIFDYLMPGFLYGYETFRKELELPVAKNKDEEASERLKKMVSPFILRRLKQDVLKDLPEKLEEIQFARFDAKQQQIYDGQVVHMKEMLAKQSGEEFEKNKLQVLAELTRLRQICCDPSLLFENYNGESAKRQACIDLIKSAIEGEHRILLFSQFTSMLALLEESLKAEGIAFYKITGQTPKEERIRLVKQFNEGTVPVFLISLKAGGTGLNLTGADVVIHYDPWWNQAVQNQATDRAHRIGQKKVVTVYKLIMKDSIEEKIVRLQEAKKNLADEILSGENGGLSQMSKEDLLALL